MADNQHRHSDNVPGPWYVDNNCIDCDLCGETAPRTFQRSGDCDHHRVFHQPASPEELCAAEEARQHCPVDAIGNDG
jgi:ferredoxin